MRFAARLAVCTIVMVLGLREAPPACAQFTVAEPQAQLYPHFTNRLYLTDPPVIVVARKVDVAFLERVQNALTRPVTIHHSGPLQDVLLELCHPVGLPCVIHRKSLEEAGIQPDSTVDLKLANVSLNTALDAALRPLSLDWCLRSEAITIASEENVSVSLEIRAYPVGDIVAVKYDDGTTDEHYDSLIEVITSNIEPSSWDEVGGPGSMRQFNLGHVLLVSQTGHIHDQISRLLAALRQAKGAALKNPARETTVRLLSSEQFIRPAQNVTGAINAQLLTSENSAVEAPVIEVLPPHEIAVRGQLRPLLDRRHTWQAGSVKLQDLVEQLAAKSGASWRLDLPALGDAGVDADYPVELPSHDCTLRSALRQMLRRCDLTYVIRGESFLITTPEKASAQLEGRVYYVGDLVQSPGDTVDYDSVIEAITTLVHPTTWDEVGGPGSIREFAYAQSLVFCQTQEVHDEIELLLAALRMSKAFADGKLSLPAAPTALPTESAAPATPQRSVHINNQQPAWRLPRIHN